MPLEVTDWVDKQTLRNWAAAEIATLDWQNPKVKEFLRARPQYLPRVMLGLLSYAYLAGVFESDEVEALCRYEPAYRSLSEGHPLTANELARFRKENRGLLKWVLARVLERALRSFYGLPETPLPAGLHQAIVASAVDRLDLARHIDREAQGA
jgi:hypothetical protein